MTYPVLFLSPISQFQIFRTDGHLQMTSELSSVLDFILIVLLITAGFNLTLLSQSLSRLQTMELTD